MKKCSQCDKPSLKGLAPGNGLCRYHWAVLHWGKEWADFCESLLSKEPKPTKNSA